MIPATIPISSSGHPRSHTRIVISPLLKVGLATKEALPSQGLGLSTSGVSDSSLIYRLLLLSVLSMGLVWNARKGAFEPYEAGFGPLEPLPRYPPGRTVGTALGDSQLSVAMGERPSYHLAALPLTNYPAGYSPGSTAQMTVPQVDHPNRPGRTSRLTEAGPVVSNQVPRAPTPHPAAPGPFFELLEIRQDLFRLGFQVFVEVKGKRSKDIWRNVNDLNVLIPGDLKLNSRSLKCFKKAIASVCYRAGLPMKRVIAHWDHEKKLSWKGHINGTTEFARCLNVDIDKEDVFDRFLKACSVSTKTMGVRISMTHPGVKAVELQTDSAVRSTLKRMIKEHTPSSDEKTGDEPGSSNDTETDGTLQEDSAQDLSNACIEIRKALLGSDLTTGEAPYCAHPENPHRRIRITNALLRLWAQDLVNKVPGISTTVPPMARPEFTGKRGEKRTCWDKNDENAPLAGGSCEGNGPKGMGEADSAAALAADVAMSDYIYFANIRDDTKVEDLCRALGSLGIDHWSVFLSTDCLEPLKEAGVDFGTRQKLVISARRFELKLIRQAGNVQH